MSNATDCIRRASWTAQYKDGGLEIVVPRDVALAVVNEPEGTIERLDRELAEAMRGFEGSQR